MHRILSPLYLFRYGKAILWGYRQQSSGSQHPTYGDICFSIPSNTHSRDTLIRFSEYNPSQDIFACL
ncbi:hypothetical protein PNOK_0952700 [Pyrrhoderma noxium]|uniref:Uncharacterized protein n=1 Tax=Pyrrhoderma noxium TaxID=2282107 RepID=A0A286U600_9AGAM|nr:hypothetical protein PNOK_0952700 [Pyrrhoderma noxium]